MILIEDYLELSERNLSDLIKFDIQSLLMDMEIKAKAYLRSTKNQKEYLSLTKKIDAITGLKNALNESKDREGYYHHVCLLLAKENKSLKETLKDRDKEIEKLNNLLAL